MQKEIITFLKSHPLISLNQLEKICGVTQRTLGKAIKGERSIPIKNVDSLIKELKKYGLLVKQPNKS